MGVMRNENLNYAHLKIDIFCSSQSHQLSVEKLSDDNRLVEKVSIWEMNQNLHATGVQLQSRDLECVGHTSSTH
jgi:hypothetical protein